MLIPSVPISAQDVADPDCYNTGSGFFATTGERFWLISAAHVPIAMQPHTNWKAWPRTLWLFPTVKGKMLFELFDGSGAPRFRCAADGTGMADFMAFPVYSHIFAPGGIMAHYTVFDLNGTHPAPGLAVRMAGYPNTNKVWPCSPPEELSALIIGYNDGLVEVDTQASNGFSGGPAFTDDGLVGMTIGSTDGRGRLVRAAWMAGQLVAV